MLCLQPYGGSPFADVNYTVNLQILPTEKIEQIQPEIFTTKPQNIYVAEETHYPIVATLPEGKRLAVGDSANLEFQTLTGKPLTEVLKNYPETALQPRWVVTKGQDRINIDAQGHLQTLQTGDVSLQGTIPGIAARKGFLFIQALGRVGVLDDSGLMSQTEDGGTRFNISAIHWDILLMVAGFGISLYINQLLSGQGGSGSNPQQQAMNKYLPLMLSGMFLFFPLPAGVLLYMLIANIFQTVQSFFLAREPLPENLQKIVDEEERRAAKQQKKMAAVDKNRKPLPFEPEYAKKKAAGEP